MVLVVNSWVLASGSPVAMLQHATSSQSIVFHPVQAASVTPPVTTTSPVVSSSESHVKYEYKYEVLDHQTGDKKSHWERRDGDNVRGVYTLYEPDGALRTVEYTADALHGFNAVVRRNKPNKHSRHNSGYPHDTPPRSVQETYDSSSKGFSSERHAFSSQSGSLRSPGKVNSYNQGVDFSVVHDKDSDLN